MTEAQVELIFDGQCGFCTRSVRWIQRLDRHRRIACYPYQNRAAVARAGLSVDDARQAVWVIDAGQAHRGAAGINKALDVAVGVGVFTAIYRVRAIRGLQDAAYRWIAAHRHRFPGMTPWCTTHPEDCGAAAAEAADH